MTVRGKSGKTKSRFSTLPTALGNPQEQRIPTFTTATAAAMVPGAAVFTQPHSNNNIPRWAGINRRNGPKEVAKPNRKRIPHKLVRRNVESRKDLTE